MTETIEPAAPAVTGIASKNWTPPRAVNTRNGPRQLRTLELHPNSTAWVAWRYDKDRVKALRFGLGKTASVWELTHWQETEGQFESDCAALDKIVVEAADAEARAEIEQKIDFVADDYEPLRSEPAGKLFEWQRPSCQRIVAALKRGNAIDASQTGSGKTYVALAACAELGLTPFIVAPLAVLESWRRAAAFLGVKLGDVTNYDKARNGSCSFISRDKSEEFTKADHAAAAERKPRPLMFRFSPPAPRVEPVRRWREDLFSDCPAAGEFRPVLILDEVQKCKSGMGSLQGRILVDAARSGAKILMISATAAKDPTEMEGTGLALGLHAGENFAKWQLANGCTASAYGIKFTDKPKVAAAAMAKLHRKIFPNLGTRIRSADVPGYPQNAVSAHLVNSADVVEAYEKMNDGLQEIESDLERGKLDAREAAGCVLAEITKARVASERGKLDWMIEEAQELISDGFRVPIFLNFRKHLAYVRDKMKLKTPPIWGTEWLGERLEVSEDGSRSRMVAINGRAQTAQERQSIIDGFQMDRQKIILVSLSAGGAGISLHDDRGNGPRSSLISPSYSAIDIVQAVGRIWRAGSHSAAVQRIIYAAGTIEEEIAASITAKIANIETLNDGDMRPDCLARFTCISTTED